MTPSERLLPGSGMLFTNRAIRILTLAGKLARQSTSNVLPLHVLQAVAWGERGNGRAILELCRIDLPEIVGKPPELLDSMLGDARIIPLELHELSYQLLEYGRDENLSLGLGRAIGTETLIFGILRMNELPESKILTQHGVTLGAATE